MAKMKELRKMKVYEQSGYHYKSTPAIMMKGRWLKECGFDAGVQIMVRCEDGKLTITRAEEVEADFNGAGNEVLVNMVAESKGSDGYGKTGDHSCC